MSLQDYLRELTPVSKGMPVTKVASHRRINALQGAVIQLAERMNSLEKAGGGGRREVTRSNRRPRWQVWYHAETQRLYVTEGRVAAAYEYDHDVVIRPMEPTLDGVPLSENPFWNCADKESGTEYEVLCIWDQTTARMKLHRREDELELEACERALRVARVVFGDGGGKKTVAELEPTYNSDIIWAYSSSSCWDESSTGSNSGGGGSDGSDVDSSGPETSDSDNSSGGDDPSTGGSDSSGDDSSDGDQGCIPTVSIDAYVVYPDCYSSGEQGPFGAWVAYTVSIGAKPGGCNCPGSTVAVSIRLGSQAMPSRSLGYGSTYSDMEFLDNVAPCSTIFAFARVASTSISEGLQNPECSWAHVANTTIQIPCWCEDSSGGDGSDSSSSGSAGDDSSGGGPGSDSSGGSDTDPPDPPGSESDDPPDSDEDSGSGGSGSEGSDGGSDSEGSGSGSEGDSGSGGSESDGSGSDSSGGSGGDPPSDSGSDSGGDSGSDSGSDGGSGSDKNCIVPAGDRFVALACVESPETWFTDYLDVTVSGRITRQPIDAIFDEVCEPGTLRVVAAVPDRACGCGARIDGGQLVVETGWYRRAARVTVTLAGKRKGSLQRFPERTREQYERSSKFWKELNR